MGRVVGMRQDMLNEFNPTSGLAPLALTATEIAALMSDLSGVDRGQHVEHSMPIFRRLRIVLSSPGSQEIDL